MNVPKLRFPEFNGEWKEKKMDEITSVITKGTTPSSIGYKFIDNGINFIKTENISENGNIDIIKTPKISEDCNKSLSRSQLEVNDILFSIAGTLGRTTIVKKEYLPANTNQAMSIIRLKNKTMVIFINYLLNLGKIKKYINLNVTVGAQPNLNLQQIGKINIMLPSPSEQKKIASFLTKVDEKLEKLEKKEAAMENFQKSNYGKII